MIIVTGGAGFIGSALVAGLNARGRKDILIVDAVDHEEKEHNLKNLSYESVVGIAEFRKKLQAGEYDMGTVEAIFHLGAESSTMVKDWNYLSDNNVQYTQELIKWCVEQDVRLVYASSAATYGNGEHGYSDSHELFDKLVPLNLYGKSKLDVDIWARNNGFLNKVVGLRYFNVFGPNEFHKGPMMSVVAKKYEDVAKGAGIELFRSYDANYTDGEFFRDFVYVKDAIDITLFFFDNPNVAGVFNVGTGKAETWNAVAKALFEATGKPSDIRYVDMPEALRAQYQYFTEADMSKLKSAGWHKNPTPLKDSIADYVQNYLAPHKHLGL